MQIQSYSAGNMAKTTLYYMSIDRWKIETTICGVISERGVFGDENKARKEFEKEKRCVDRIVAKKNRREK